MKTKKNDRVSEVTTPKHGTRTFISSNILSNPNGYCVIMLDSLGRYFCWDQKDPIHKMEGYDPVKVWVTESTPKIIQQFWRMKLSVNRGDLVVLQ